jgi:DNA-binding MarR family transcriptional regulator
MSNIELNTEEKELEVLKYIYANADNVHQRDLAKIVGLSLGMTNAILKRLAQKGFLKIRKVNNRNIKYIVSAQGIEAITRRSYQFFKRTIKSVVFYKETIESLIRDIKKEGYEGVLLIGRSDLDFLIEHVCTKYGMLYVKEPSDFHGRLFSVYSESYLIDEETEEAYADRHVEFLQRVLMV